MPEQVGSFQIGVALGLADLKVQVGALEPILQSIEQRLAKVEGSAESTDQALHGLGAAAVVANNTLELLGKGVEFARGTFELFAGGLETLKGVYEGTIAATAEWAHHLEVQATMVGDTVEHFQALDTSMKIFSGGMGSATTALRFLGRNMQTVAGGEAMNAKEAFKQLGVSVVEGGKYMKDTGVILDELAPKFAAMPDGPTKTAMAMALFGRFGATMIPLLNEIGKSGLTVTQYMQKFGLTLSAEVVEAGAKYQHQVEIIQQQLAMFPRIIGGAAIPAFEGLAEAIRGEMSVAINWANLHQGEIANVAEAIAGALRRGLDAFERLGRGIVNNIGTIQRWAREGVSIGMSVLLGWANLLTYAAEGVALLDQAMSLASGKMSIAEADAAAASMHRLAEERRAGISAVQGQLDAYNEDAKSIDRNSAAAQRLIAVVKSASSAITDQSRQGVASEGEFAGAWERLKALAKDVADGHLRVNAATRSELEQLGLLTAAIEPHIAARERTRVAIIAGHKAQDEANKAIAEEIQKLTEEMAALTGGEAARTKAMEASAKFAGASAVLKAQLDGVAQAVNRAKEELRDLAPAFELMKPKTIEADSLSRQKELNKAQAQLTLDQAKATGDAEVIKRAELQKTLQDAKSALDEEVRKNQDQINSILALRAKLMSSNENDRNVALTELAKDNSTIRDFQVDQTATAEEQNRQRLENALNASAAEVATRESTNEQLKALYQADTAARIKAAEEAAAQINAINVDIAAEMKTVSDDVFNSMILGTRKWSDVWKSAWQSAAKEALGVIEKIAIQYALIGTAPSVIPKIGGIDVSSERSGGILGWIFGKKSVEPGTGTLTETNGILRQIYNAIVGTGGLMPAGAGVLAPTGQAPGIIGLPAGANYGVPPIGGLAGPLPEGAGTVLGGDSTPVVNALKDTTSVIRDSLEKSTQVVSHDTKDSGKMVSASVDQSGNKTGLGMAQTGAAIAGVGGILTGIGAMVGGKTGQIIQLIGEIITFLGMALIILQLINVKPSILGFSYGTGGVLHAQSGLFVGGTPGRDSIPILGMPGEGILNLDAMRHIGGPAALNILNAGGKPWVGDSDRPDMRLGFANPSLAAVVSRYGLSSLERSGGASSSSSSVTHVNVGPVTVHVPSGDPDLIVRRFAEGVQRAWNR